MFKYENVDGVDSFKFSLGNGDTIKYFVLSVYNQDGTTISDMQDYFMHFHFIIRNKNETNLILNKILDCDKENYLTLGHNFNVLNNTYNFMNKTVMNYFGKISNV